MKTEKVIEVGWLILVFFVFALVISVILNNSHILAFVGLEPSLNVIPEREGFVLFEFI